MLVVDAAANVGCGRRKMGVRWGCSGKNQEQSWRGLVQAVPGTTKWQDDGWQELALGTGTGTVYVPSPHT